LAEATLEQMVCRHIADRALIVEEIGNLGTSRIPPIPASKPHHWQFSAQNRSRSSRIIEVCDNAIPIPGAQVGQSLVLKCVFLNVDNESATLMHVTGYSAYDL
jgi:hypothetical protein